MIPLISIILPVYNGERYLTEAIESCLNQTFQNFELIIVDDCSTDNSLSLARDFQKRDSRINVIENKTNRKLPASLNIGHHCAKGDYLTWTSDDNILKNNMLDVLLNSIKETQSDLVFSDYDVIESDGKFRRTHHAGPVCRLPFGSTIGASFLYKKRVFWDIGGYDESLHLIEDYDFWIRTAMCYRFFYVNRSLYKYRVHKKNLTSQIRYDSSFTESFIEKRFKIYDKFLETINGSQKTKDFLIRTAFYRQWDWKIFKENYLIIIKDLNKFQVLIRSNDQENILNCLDYVLRNKALIEPITKSDLRWLFLKRPKIIFNYSYSKKKSLKLLKKLF